MKKFNPTSTYFTNKILLGALSCIIFASSLQQSIAYEGHGENLEIFENVRFIHFPHGFKVFNSKGRAIKTVVHATDEQVKCVIMGKPFARGKEAFMSNWSFNRFLKGEPPNWVVANDAPVVVGSHDDMEIFDVERGVRFPNGYKIYDHRGKLLKNQSGNCGLHVRGRKILSTAEGQQVAYLTVWAHSQIMAGKPPTWAIGNNAVDYPLSGLQVNSASTSKYNTLKFAREDSNEISDADAATKWKLLGLWKDATQSYEIKNNDLICIRSDAHPEISNTWDVKDGYFIWESKPHKILTLTSEKLEFRPKEAPGPIFTLSKIQEQKEESE